MQMTEQEICASYKSARKPDVQLQILAELNNVKQIEIIKVLLKNGERITGKAERKMYKRLDILDARIQEIEREYSEIAQVLKRNRK